MQMNTEKQNVVLQITDVCNSYLSLNPILAVSFSSIWSTNFDFVLMDSSADWVDVANDLLCKCHINLRIQRLTECDASVFVALYEAILGEKVPGKCIYLHF